MKNNWTNKSFNELNNKELYDIIKVRSKVFQIEQNCLYLDLDDIDTYCFHLFLKSELDSSVVSYCRIIPPNIRYPEVSIGRVLTIPSKRKKGLAREMMEIAIAFVQKTWPQQNIQISAQVYLEEFYQSLQFQTISDVYLEDNVIEHVKMLWKAPL